MNFSPEFKKYFANTSWLMGERILRMVVALFVGVYVARYLGPERFGLLSYANSFVGLFIALATLGLDGIVVRELVKTPERRDELLGTAFWLKIGGAVLLWVAIVAAVPLTKNDIITNSLITIIAFAVIFQAFNVIDFNYQAEVKSKYVVHAQLVQLVISSITKLILIAIKAPLIWFAWVYCLDAIVLAVALAVMYWCKSGSFWVWRLRWQVARELLRDSWPLILSSISFVVYTNIDKIMIKEMLDAKSVGVYNAAAMFVLTLHFIPGLFINSLMPLLVNSKNNKILLHKRLARLSIFLIGIASFIAIIYQTFSYWIIINTFGVEYIKTVDLLAYMPFSLIIIFYSSVFNIWMLIENKNKISLFFQLLSSILNIVLNFYLIKIFGVIGAVYALIGSLFITYVIVLYFYRKEYVVLLLNPVSIF